MKGFGDRVVEAVALKGSCVCVGLDPRFFSLPTACVDEGRAGTSTQRTAAAEACRIFCLRVIDLVEPFAVAVKPQAAFFELFGSAGMAAFEEVCAAARSRGLLVIADVKRGDIGSTAEAYAEAYLAPRGEEPPLADACTVNPWLGSDGILPFVEKARRHGNGLFVLVRTSNPSSRELQELESGGEPLYLRVARLVTDLGADLVGASGYGPVGAVVGATFPEVLAACRSALPASVLLLPGYGAQGAGAGDVARAFDAGGQGCLVTASRSITFPWPKGAPAPGDWEERIAAAARIMRDELRGVGGGGRRR